MGHMLLAIDSPLMANTHERAAILMVEAMAVAHKTRPADPVESILGNTLLTSLQAVMSEAISLGMPEDMLDKALAFTFGWLMTAGPEHLHPMGSDCAHRIERFIKTTLCAAELTRQTLDVGMETRGAA